MTSSNGNIFRVTGPLCGEFTGPGEFPTQRPVTRSFDVLFDLRLNKRLSKQPWGWWFETPSWSLWRQRNDLQKFHHLISFVPKPSSWAVGLKLYLKGQVKNHTGSNIVVAARLDFLFRISTPGCSIASLADHIKAHLRKINEGDLWPFRRNIHPVRILPWPCGSPGTDQPASSWWLQMYWFQIGTRSSATTMLTLVLIVSLYYRYHADYISRYGISTTL